jgi:hypothetical protein
MPRKNSKRAPKIISLKAQKRQFPKPQHFLSFNPFHLIKSPLIHKYVNHSTFDLLFLNSFFQPSKENIKNPSESFSAKKFCTSFSAAT